MKERLKIFLVAAVIVGMLTGVYVFLSRAIRSMDEKISQEQETSRKQNEEIAGELSRLQERLDEAESEKLTLSEKLDALIAREVYVFDAEVLRENVRGIGELATVEYCYTNVGTLDAAKKWFTSDVDIPLTKKTIVISMDGVLKVGIDVEKISFVCDEKTGTITVTLPQATLLSNELDEGSICVYNEEGGIFNRVTMIDSSLIRSKIKEKAEEKAAAAGVYEQARKNSEKLVRCVMEAVPGLSETYRIEFA